MIANNNQQFIQNSIDLLLAKLKKNLEGELINTTLDNFSGNVEHLVQEAAITYFLQNSIGLISIFDSVNSAICVTNTKGEIVYINQKFANFFGYSKVELSKMSFTFLINQSQQSIVEDKYVQFFYNRYIDDFETVGLTKNGALIDITISVQFYSNEKGLQFAISTITDISHEKYLHEALLTKNKIFDYSRELLSVIDYDGYFKLLNPSWGKKLGYTIEELLAKPFIEFVYPDDREKTNAAKFSIIDGQEVLKFENRYVCKDGKLIWLSWNAQPVPNENIMVAVARDITEEKKLKEALVTKDLIFDSSIDMLCVADFDGYYKLLNPAWQKTLGWSIEELKAKPYLEFVHPDDIESTKNIKGTIVDGSEIFQFENRLICANGSYKWLSWNSHPVPEKGVMIGVARDVTEGRRIVQQLAESESMFKSLVEDSKAGVYIIKENKFVYVNAAMCTIFGYTQSELIGQPIIKIIQPIEQNKIIEYSNQILNGIISNKHINFEGKYKTGQSVFVEIISNLTIYKGEQAIIGSLLDVTEQSKYFTQLKKLYTAIQQSQASVVITDVEGTIEFVNDAFLQITGYDRTEALGKNPRILKSGITHQNTYEEMWATLTAKKNWQGALINKRKNGSIYWESVNITPITNDAGEIINYVAVKEDITHKIKEEEERKLLIEELTRNNKELKQFSYITSHNMRAPLTNLLALDGLIDRSRIIDSGNLELLDLMHESIENLNSTLNDLIKILVIKEQTNIALEELTFETICNETLQSIHSIVEDATIETNFENAPKVHFNKSYLESIFLNLLTNAVKYAHPERKVIVKINSKNIGDEICIVFSDNGLGFDLERVKDRLFGLYQRFHNNSNSKGIGLYLVHSQVTALGGKIDVQSEENNGTTFTIYFKVKKNQTV